MIRRLLRVAPALLLVGCVSTGGAGSASAADLPQWFNCLRERGEAVVSVHRGGPAPGLPENALATMAATLDHLPGALLEIDIQQSRDGILFLFHDDRLDRKSTGQGRVQDKDWAELASLRLRDRDGTVTAQPLPLLRDALALVRARGALVQLDVKRGVDFAAVVAAVRQAGATHHVVIITYRDEDALAVARLAPELMISASISSPQAAKDLIAKGVSADRLLAWTGTKAPDAALFIDLRARGIEPLFGSLGRPGERLDDIWLADGDAGEFAALERAGAVVVATDRAKEVAAALGPVSCSR